MGSTVVDSYCEFAELPPYHYDTDHPETIAFLDRYRATFDTLCAEDPL